MSTCLHVYLIVLKLAGSVPSNFMCTDIKLKLCFRSPHVQISFQHEGRSVQGSVNLAKNEGRSSERKW